MTTVSDKNTLDGAIRRNNADEIYDILSSKESVEDHVLAEIISRMGATDPVIVSAIIIDQISKFTPNGLGLAVISALKEGRQEIASLIMDSGGLVIINAKDANGITPLIAAAANNGADFARKHLMSRISTEGVEALITAATVDNQDMIKFLLENGVNVNAVDKTGATALMYAAENGSLDLVKVLLENNADINLVDSAGKTALMYAAKSGDLNLLRTMLLEKGGDPYLAGLLIPDKNGKYDINPKIKDADSRQVITDYLALEQEFRENFANKVRTGLNTSKLKVEDVYKTITVSLNPSDESKQFASSLNQNKLRIKLNFVDKFIIEIKALLGISDKLDAAQERICMRIEEKIYEGIRRSELFKKLTPELEGNVSVAKALTGIEDKLASKAEQIAAKRANKLKEEARGK